MISAGLASWARLVLDHLWQSTVFAGGVWLLTLALRRNPAKVRFRLWMAASLKFFIPFTLLIALGARLPWPAHLDRTQPAVAAAVQRVAEPLLVTRPSQADLLVSQKTAGSTTPYSWADWPPLILAAVWVCGTLLLGARWTAHWLQLRDAVRGGEPITLPGGTEARLVPENIEPGVFGVVHPLLLLPRGISDRLSTQQLDAIVAHELCHVRRRDNLTAALHMAVEALFWFHPLVWWLRTRLMEERERACDEAVLEAAPQPFAYVEGILNVCKFYVEAPLNCVSGVTGSDLKRRVARILSGQSVRVLDGRRKALLALAAISAVAAPVTAGLVCSTRGQTQTAAPAKKSRETPGTAIAGIWQGVVRLPDGRNWRLVLKIARDDHGALSGTFYSIDQNGPPFAGNSVSFDEGTLRFVNTFPGMKYEGKMAADGNSIGGTITQNGSFPLVLERSTPDTEWAIPAPPPQIPPMAPDVSPDVEVATIKPSPPDARRSMFRMLGANLLVENLTLDDLIKFACDVQQRQISGGPGWMSTEKWDIQAKPDTPGMPRMPQLQEMVRKLLAERFGLQFHEEKRVMAAYVLTVAKGGPRLTRNTDPSHLDGFSMGPLGTMHAGAATMGDLAQVLQSDVLDRPVVDQTGLEGRWDFTLQWAPDEAQFPGMKVPRSASDVTDPLPPLFTAIQEQLGLKLEPQRLDVPVLVIDHVDHPTPN